MTFKNHRNLSDLKCWISEHLLKTTLFSKGTRLLGLIHICSENNFLGKITPNLTAFSKTAIFIWSFETPCRTEPSLCWKTTYILCGQRYFFINPTKLRLRADWKTRLQTNPIETTQCVSWEIQFNYNLKIERNWTLDSFDQRKSDSNFKKRQKLRILFVLRFKL